ncbi:hypothetical protein like AT4G29090 [Hibiscus trionum]|uniref:Reverse transcriptase zinc-binding domain-containing protein n=1 Tax=Hibiscus trionum TaxID=183268 RepID=A0A9W7LVU0_HIBTR|nr:hypothetical protein like AT4G29090 [Hibiscus trionum]
MGFRDMCKFNIALLDKQGWRVVQNPDSLVARLLRSKYFSTTDFMHAPLGSNPSYIWKSIWSFRGLLEKDCKWSVGCGSSINIWNDFWLPGYPQRKITSTSIHGLSTVSSLLSPTSLQ